VSTAAAASSAGEPGRDADADAVTAGASASGSSSDDEAEERFESEPSEGEGEGLRRLRAIVAEGGREVERECIRRTCKDPDLGIESRRTAEARVRRRVGSTTRLSKGAAF
jgi:hypothetical protein